MIKGNKKYAFKKILRNYLAPALFRAVLDVFPVLGPLLAPLESPTTTSTDIWLEAIFDFWSWAHVSSLIRQKRQLLDNPS
jgi:hypothetical protein